MDFAQRIAEASQYRDQTRDSYNMAQSETKQALSAYDRSFTEAPTYDSLYKQAKADYYDTEEISTAKSSLDLARETVEGVRTMIDKLPQSINQRFGGTSLTQAQRDMAKQKDLQQLNGNFNQYDANYQVSFRDYNTLVDRAFSETMNVSSSEYDSYWDGVQSKFDMWQTKIGNEEQWSKLYNTSQMQLLSVNHQKQMYDIQQRGLQARRDIINRSNQNSAQLRNMYAQGAASMAAARARTEAVAGQNAAVKQKWQQDVKAYQEGRLSSQVFGQRMDSGAYRY